MHGTLLRAHRFAEGQPASESRLAFMNTKESAEQTARAGSQYADMWRQGWEPYVQLFRQFAQPNATLPDLGKVQQRYMEFASNEGAAAYRKFSELSANYY